MTEAENQPIDARALEIGTRLGHYEITEHIGSGGMGEVYLARDMKLGRRVAIKVLHEEFARDQSNLKRFISEAKVVSSLNHPNILVIHEIGEHANSPYIVSEFVAGETLREVIQNSSLKISETLDIAIQLSRALAVAHEAHIVHRDVKPENVIIGPDGHAKVLDFGIAKLIRQEGLFAGHESETATENLTAQGTIIGTVSYMSPEQATGRTVDQRSDIFSLGAVIYEMVSGISPFHGQSQADTLANLLKSDPKPLQDLVPLLPKELSKIIAKALCKDLESRYQNMRDMVADLNEARAGLAYEERSGSLGIMGGEKTQILPTGSESPKNSLAAAPRTQNSRRWLTRPLIPAAFVFLLALSAGSYYWWHAGGVMRANDQGPKTLAVLPFLNLTDDADSEYLSDGLSDSIIDSLSKLSGLRVVSRNSSSRFRTEQANVQDIASKLNVDAVVTGDIKRLGEKMIIGVRLLNGSDDTQIWADQFTVSSSDIISAQNQIANAVVRNLRLKLSSGDTAELAKLPTTNAEAYQLFLKARYAASPATPDALLKSIDLYKQATQLDPQFALADEEIGVRYLTLGIYFLPPREMMPNAKAYANKALSIDDGLSDAHILLGQIALLYDWDWDNAKAELVEGNLVKPESVETFTCTAHILQATGRVSQSEETLSQALAKDPISITLNTERGCNSYYSRRIDQSIEEYREAIALEPKNFPAQFGLGRSLNQAGRYGESINELEKVRNFMPVIPPIASAEIGFAYAKSGNSLEARKVIKQLEEQSQKIYVDPFLTATVYRGLGDKDQTFAWLQKAFEVRSGLLLTIINDMKWDTLREDKRFKDLLLRIGVANESSA